MATTKHLTDPPGARLAAVGAGSGAGGRRRGRGAGGEGAMQSLVASIGGRMLVQQTITRGMMMFLGVGE